MTLLPIYYQSLIPFMEVRLCDTQQSQHSLSLLLLYVYDRLSRINLLLVQLGLFSLFSLKVKT